jgi:hypothetical protein
VKVTTMFSRKCGTRVRVALAGVLAATALLAAPAPAMAQDDPNPGALTFTGGLDVPSIYFFRGLRQETDQKLTLWPYGDLGIAFFSGDGGLKSAGVNIGVWNSLHTGSSGTNGPSAHAHYEEDFYATLALGFGGGVTVAPGYMALTSPNLMFNTVKEFQLKVSKAHMLAPYGFLAMELTEDGHADAGTHKGTYLELGVGPSWPLVAGGPTLAIPVKLGLSLKDYYEDATGNDSKFGFFDVGGLITVPLKGIPGKFGAWNIHGGVDFLFLGDTPKLFNVNKDGEQKDKKVVGLFGIGVTY